MVIGPVSAYSMSKNSVTGQIIVGYDNKQEFDEEMIYTFNPDGSATAYSCAWGSKTECPKGAFSDVLAKLPEVDKYTAELARDLAVAYSEYEKKNKLKPTWLKTNNSK